MEIDKAIAECNSIAEIAKGGQKVVWSAKHPVLGDIVLKRGKYLHPAALERIQREVDLLAAIHSPYYPKHYKFIIAPQDKEFLIVEERINGGTLADHMDQLWDEQSILKLIKELIKGLTFLWSERVVHRDIKPQNILIRDNGAPVIIDLGIARLLDLSSLTLPGAPMGPCSLLYASPEQLVNNKSIIDHRSDFFSIGIVSLQLYLGFHPFDPEKTLAGESIPENILRGRYVRPEERPDASKAFVQLINKLLKTQPHERFRNSEAFMNFIENQWGQK